MAETARVGKRGAVVSVLVQHPRDYLPAKPARSYGGRANKRRDRRDAR